MIRKCKKKICWTNVEVLSQKVPGMTIEITRLPEEIIPGPKLESDREISFFFQTILPRHCATCTSHRVKGVPVLKI